MNSNSLKIVVSYDDQRKKFKPVFHNLNADAAENEVRKLESEKIRARILVQSRHHRGQRAEECRACRDAAAKLQTSEGGSSGAVAGPSSESDSTETGGDTP
jgi:hypothetical protein